MARGVNKVILVGSCGKDPETRYMPSGGAVTSISVATSEAWTDKQSGEKKEATEWHNITFFNRLAEIAGEYLKKGSLVYIEGKLKADKYTDKQGVEKYSTKIIASELQMLGSKPSDQQGASQPAQREPQQADSSQHDGFDSDIPFN